METPSQPRKQSDKASENKIKKEKITKWVIWAAAIIVVIVVAVFVYISAFRSPAIKAGNEAIGQADVTMMSQGNDTLALEQYLQVAAAHGQDAGNRAKLMAAILNYRQGEYQKALDLLKGYDQKESIIGSGSYSLQGDCYVNLEQYDKALACYDKAVSKSDDNPWLTPFFICKKARIYRELGDFEKEYQTYGVVRDKYPEYYNTLGLEKFLERARLNAGK